jgi:hypothetical protein
MLEVEHVGSQRNRCWNANRVTGVFFFSQKSSDGRFILFAKIFGRVHTSLASLAEDSEGEIVTKCRRSIGFWLFPWFLCAFDEKHPNTPDLLIGRKAGPARRSFVGRTLPGMSERKEQHGRKRAQEMAFAGWPVEAQIGGACSGPSGWKRRNYFAVSRPTTPGKPSISVFALHRLRKQFGQADAKDAGDEAQVEDGHVPLATLHQTQASSSKS